MKKAPGGAVSSLSHRASGHLLVIVVCDADVVLPALMLAGLAATSLLLAASLRLRALGPTLLAAYVALVAETAALTLALSPLRAVTRGGLAAGEAAVLAAALVLWWRRGRPGSALVRGVGGVVRIARDPIVAVFLAIVVVSLAYELVLVLTVPANNWDSLTYHLARAAAWFQHGGVYWIPHAPTDRMNEFQPLAEQEILLLFVATAKGALFALPQYVSELAIVVGIYTTTRRLGFDGRSALLSALLFASLPLVALEATTAQNDLVAASLPLAAVAFLLGGGTAEVTLAGVAIGLGLGVKLTTALALPVIAVLAARLGHRRALVFGGTTVVTFAALSSWSFVLNVVETDHVLGRGGGRVEHTTTPSFPGSLATGGRILYRLFDLSGFEAKLVGALLLVAVAVAPALVIALRRRGSSPRAAWTTGGMFAVFLLIPTFLTALAALQAHSGLLHLASSDRLNSRANEDVSSFGPLGLVLLGASILALAAGLRRRTDPRALALACSLPLSVAVLALTSRYNPWLSRLLVVPAALTAPLLAPLFRSRSRTVAVAVVAATTLALGLGRNELKPLDGSAERPWQLSQVEAVALTWKPQAGRALAQLDELVAERACLGALLDVDEPSYLVFGPRLDRPVTFLPRESAPQAAEREGVPYVVIGSGDVALLADGFKAGGWALRPLDPGSGNYWTLAISPRGGGGRCHSSTAAEQAKTLVPA